MEFPKLPFAYLELPEDLVIGWRPDRPTTMQGDRYRAPVRVLPPFVAPGLSPALETKLSSNALELPGSSARHAELQ